MITEEGSSVLLTQFRDFYCELINIKKLANSGITANAVAERITVVMEQQSILAGRRGVDYTGFYRQAEYVMAALADEILLHHLEWPGKNVWNNHLIEYRLFKTRVAGEVFFERLDRLLQTPDPLYKDLATVYLLAIMLGFRGKYWGGNDQGKIAFYRRQLFTFIYHGQPELKKETKKLFPEAYLHTVEEGAGRKVPQVKIWYFVLAVLIVGYFFVSRSIWLRHTTDLETTTRRIELLQQQ